MTTSDIRHPTSDIVVTGSLVADIIVRPVALNAPLGAGTLHRTQPMILTPGGITANAGITLARLGVRTAVHSFVGNDAWSAMLRERFAAEGVDTRALVTHSDAPTSTTVVLVDAAGERSFLHAQGAPKKLTAAAIREQWDLYAGARFALFGYYSLTPGLDSELPAVLRDLRAAGCRTALDASGDGGTMKPLDEMLPHLDVYFPSRDEAMHQTGQTDPRKMIETYRPFAPDALLGVKLGAEGLLLSERAGEFLHQPAVPPPGDVVDTTGAGDSCFAGLLAGLVKGLPLRACAQAAAAAGACAVTAVGGWAGARSWDALRALAR